MVAMRTSFYRSLPLIFPLLLLGGLLALPGGEESIFPSSPHRIPVPVRPSEPVRFIAIGDVMLGRHVRTLMEAEGEAYPFLQISEFLKDADFVWANLEGPVVRNAPVTPLPSLKFAFQETVPRLLFSHNIQAVSLANNHTLDQGPEGYTSSVELLTKAGVQVHGHAAKIWEGSILTREIRGENLQLVAMNATWPTFKEAEALDVIRKAALKGPVFVTIHWGAEYAGTAKEEERTWAHNFIDAGASAVIGHHPHVVQDVEIYRGRPIFYSLGNFIFDQYFSKETQEGLAVKIELGTEAITYRLFPYHIRRSQPVLMEEDEAKLFLHALAEKSSENLRNGIERGEIALTRE
jgi:gamma-polyglutamate biosynthesis protein CapA